MTETPASKRGSAQGKGAPNSADKASDKGADKPKASVGVTGSETVTE